MARLSLYRKWRPQDFDNIFGQDHIIKTLQNAIETGRIAHAYLFAGPRGTGKTTTARLLAKALNCVHGPTPNPCDECENCVSIREGRSLDVYEIDGASNRGIDEIRELRDTVRFKATQGRYKVYIIDEIHMLTIEAFNALLKTLEEPPKYVVFVFATTEQQKIPATILSRCQRFTFRRIPSEIIVQRLLEVSENENIKVEDGALRIIAEMAQGGMRDALSLLDQSMAFSNDVITTNVVEEMLGLTDSMALTTFYRALIDKELKMGLELINSATSEGKDLVHFMESAMQVARSMLVVKADKEVSVQTGEILLSKSREEFIDLAKALDNGFLVTLIETLAEAIQKSKQTADPELFLQLAVVKLVDTKTMSASVNDVDNTKISMLVEQIEEQKKRFLQLEKTIKEGRFLESKDTDISSFWEEVLQKLKERKETLEFWAFLNVAEPIALVEQNLYIAFPEVYEFHRANVENPKNKGLIELKLSEIIGKNIKLHVDKDPNEKSDPNFLSKTQDVFGGTTTKTE